MYKHVENLCIVNIPKLIYYDHDHKIMTTTLIDSLNVADQYTDNPECVPDSTYESIIDIINTLYDNKIIYPDITGYNFIEDGEKIWIIDFEHAKTLESSEIHHKNFVKDICKWNKQKSKIWNSYFE
jgi:tRNA A-37 threonylcarbamoyl transferase component Bud32